MFPGGPPDILVSSIIVYICICLKMLSVLLRAPHRELEPESVHMRTQLVLKQGREQALSGLGKQH